MLSAPSMKTLKYEIEMVEELKKNTEALEKFNCESSFLAKVMIFVAILQLGLVSFQLYKAILE
jgi:hypothetical protein